MPCSEEDLIPISALQHYMFCPRQCALIHLEQQWVENVLTAEGRILHDRAHEAGSENRGDVRTVRGLRLRSLTWGLVGQADVVEFKKCKRGEEGVLLEGADGRWRPHVVEYKRGKPKIDRCDEVQVCAQVLCIEEMLGVEIGAAAMFYGQPHRRHDVVIDAALRAETAAAIEGTRTLMETAQTPQANYSKKCKSCSLLAVCLPKTTSGSRSAKRYLKDVLLREGQEE